MTLGEIKDEIMFQTNNDSDDIEDYLPFVDNYINEGYDKLVKAWGEVHVPTGEYARLVDNDDVPQLPEWTHRAICDWATWLVYRNGNPQKQERGMRYRESFENTLSKIFAEGGAAGLNEDGTSKQIKNFYNIPW